MTCKQTLNEIYNSFIPLHYKVLFWCCLYSLGFDKLNIYDKKIMIIDKFKYCLVNQGGQCKNIVEFKDFSRIFQGLSLIKLKRIFPSWNRKVRGKCLNLVKVKNVIKDFSKKIPGLLPYLPIFQDAFQD